MPVSWPSSNSPTASKWRLAADSVAALLRARVPTLVCCSAGMNRSVCVAVCAVTIAERLPLDEALAIVVGTGPADVSPGLLAQFQEVMQG
jgi:protein-tyrosine phosphatase